MVTVVADPITIVFVVNPTIVSEIKPPGSMLILIVLLVVIQAVLSTGIVVLPIPTSEETVVDNIKL